jgi:hypothetical protein
VPRGRITIRIWDGNRVLGVVSFSRNGGGSYIGAVGGAENSSRVDIEMDPWAGLIVDHMPEFFSPMNWREAEHQSTGDDDE